MISCKHNFERSLAVGLTVIVIVGLALASVSISQEN
jgi:hypothetical protein